jgi:hypothetical protein
MDSPSTARRRRQRAPFTPTGKAKTPMGKALKKDISAKKNVDHGKVVESKQEHVAPASAPAQKTKTVVEQKSKKVVEQKSKCCGCSFSRCVLCHPMDLLLIFWIAGTCFSIMVMDAHSVVRTILGVGHDSFLTSPLFRPLEELSAIYVLWGETVDPHLIGSPVWFSAIEVLNVFLVLPTLIVVLVGFIRRWNWIRIPAICASITMLHSLFVIFSSALFGDDYPARDVEVFFFVYISGVIFALALLWKMRQDKPFEHRPWTWKGLFGGSFIYGTLLAETAVAPYFLYVWNIRHRVNPVY